MDNQAGARAFRNAVLERFGGRCTVTDAIPLLMELGLLTDEKAMRMWKEPKGLQGFNPSDIQASARRRWTRKKLAMWVNVELIGEEVIVRTDERRKRGKIRICSVCGVEMTRHEDTVQRQTAYMRGVRRDGTKSMAQRRVLMGKRSNKYLCIPCAQRQLEVEE